MQNAEYNDPRLVEVYDAEGSWGRDDDYFLAVVNETPRSRVLDVGCGTGRLAIAIAAAGHTVTGIDPSAASLAAARMKSGSGLPAEAGSHVDRITWIQGTADAAPVGAFDVALMTGHASQFVLGADAWAATLRALWRALVPGGRLAFHAYDPAARIWERWNPEATRRLVTLPDGSTVSIWTEVTNRTDEIVSYSHYYEFSNGDMRRSDSALRFWSEGQLRESIETPGFTVVRVDGGWNGEPVGAGSGELIFVVRR